LPIGPQHPALKEVENFTLEVNGEEIVGVDIRLGYSHRGIERGMQERTYPQGVYLAERVCGICNIAHSATYCLAVEKLAGVEIPERAKIIRTILLELERIHSHLLWAGVAFYEIGFETLFMYTWRDREMVLDVREAISGARQISASNVPGGVRRDVKAEHISFALDVLKRLEESTKYYLDVCTSDPTIIARCSGVGVLSKHDATKLCATGPTARASGVEWDLRRGDPYLVYEDVDFDVVVEKDGDVFARILVRLKEVLESIRIVRQLLEKLPGGPVRMEIPKKIDPSEAIARTEAPRGELLYYMLSNGTEKPERVRIRTPTYANVLSWKPMFAGATIADAPIIIASIDPCFTCCDRLSIIDVKTGEKKLVEFRELRGFR
ncbi:MAG: nickel-dependent hydrogenase large subunit, partial [Candidatus Hadarchaeales archaeon]